MWLLLLLLHDHLIGDLLIRSDGQLAFISIILEEYLFLENLPSLLIVRHLCLIDYGHSKRTKHLKFVSLWVVDRAAVAIKTQVVVLFTSEALKSISSNRLHAALITCDILMFITL
jgi:hypothetical protein